MSFWRRVLNHVIPHHSNAYRPHMLGRSWMVFFLAIALATEGFLVASLVAHQSNSSFLAAIAQADVIKLTNVERAENHVGTVRENSFLDAAAQAKAQDMASKGYFAHQSPDGRQPWDFISASGYDYVYAGENLAVRFSESQDVVNAWMASPTHRANIVKAQYTEIGIGIADGMYKGMPATFVVQYFGSPTPMFAAREAKATSTAAAPQPAPGKVLGASVGPVNQLNSAVRQLPKLADKPQSLAAWIIGGLATLIILILGLTFMLHLQIQATDLLLPGVAVAMVALCLFVFNATVLSEVSQPAAAASALTPAVILGDASDTAK